MIVGSDLARDESGRVVVGPECEKVCEKALSVYRGIIRNDACHHRYLFISTAGKASEKWDRVVLSQVIAQRVIGTNGHLRDHSQFLCADDFTTDGEMTTLAEYLKRYKNLTSVTLIVRWWHAPRSFLLCLFRLWKKGIWVRVKVIPVGSACSLKGIVHEVLAIPANIARILTRG